MIKFNKHTSLTVRFKNSSTLAKNSRSDKETTASRLRSNELVESLPDLAGLVEPLLVVRRALREQIVVLHRRLLAIVRDDEVCRRLMTTPGVGPVVG